MAFPWAAIAVVASAGKAYAAYYEGMAKKAYYDAQADMKLLQYKDKRIESKEAGVKVLEETNKALSSIIAKGAAGGILVDEGNILVAQQVSLRNGIEDFNVAQINQEIMQNLGIVEFTNLRAAGKAAKKAGIMSAIFGFGTDMATLGQTGAFDNKGTA
tara:strand:+ start:131 stop:604 length:474 start_codon:yes stop_codon:yes gene_type:complete